MITGSSWSAASAADGDAPAEVCRKICTKNRAHLRTTHSPMEELYGQQNAACSYSSFGMCHSNYNNCGENIGEAFVAVLSCETADKTFYSKLALKQTELRK